MDEHKSQYGDRDTVGKIYRDLQRPGRGDSVENGDLTREFEKSLVEDLNDTIRDGTKEFEGKEFYITVHEKKDLMMPRAILRRMIKMGKRPWPEDDTIVFRVYPGGNHVRFCWCLPHYTEMKNILMNENLFDQDMVNTIKCWMRFDMHHFGFVKDAVGNWTANPHFEDKEMQPRKAKILQFQS